MSLAYNVHRATEHAADILFASCCPLFPPRWQVLFDLTSGVEALASALGSDVDAVVCAVGWDVQGFDLTQPWKASTRVPC